VSICGSPGTCACGCFACGGEEHCERHRAACHLACLSYIPKIAAYARDVPVRDGLL
jgi:hypothetical protein